MSDVENRLREELTERGVEWKEGDASHTTEWTNANGQECSAMYWKPSLTVLISGCTPEQAIAATLGSDREQRLEKLVRIYGEIANYFCERFACCDAEFANCKYCIGLPQGGQCELGWCNDESKALGIEQPDYGGGECEPVNLQELYDKLSELEQTATPSGGKLTAEQVMAIAGRHQPDYCSDTHVCFDWQAIADELNAAIGGVDSSADDALALLDEIREAGRISYDDYSRLFDAVAILGGGECESKVENWINAVVQKAVKR